MFNGRENIKKYLKKIIIFLFFILCIVAFPFIVEKIILCETIFPFDLPIDFSKEVWFGFIGSYLGAIGTIVLGYIAFYQNKKYKELSDQSEQNFLELQQEIKELTKKSVFLIDLNSKIEFSKYHPILSNLHYSFENIRGEDLEKSFDLKNDAFQISFRKENPNEYLTSYTEIFDQYYTFVFTLKNDGEKTIRNFNCTNIETNGQKYEMGFWIYQSCDINPGAILRCVYATKFDFSQKVSRGEIESLSFNYRMENVLGECFVMSVDFHFIPTEENHIDFFVEISPILRETEQLEN